MEKGQHLLGKRRRDNSVAAVQGIELDEFQYSVLDQSISEGHKVLYTSDIARGLPTQGGSCLHGIRNAGKIREIVKTYPDVQEIEQGEFDRVFSLYYITQRETQDIESQILGVSEIETTTVVALDHETLRNGTGERGYSRSCQTASFRNSSSFTGRQRNFSACQRIQGTARNAGEVILQERSGLILNGSMF